MKNKKILILFLCVVAVLVVVGAIFVYANLRNNESESNRGVNDVNYDKPTEQERQAGDNQKSENVEQSRIEQKAQTSPPSAANIVLVDGSQYSDTFEVRAYVSDVFESGGACKVEFTRDGSPSVSRTVSANASATTTQCQTVQIPVSDFAIGGTWKMLLTYESATHKGTLGPTDITIQR